MPPSARRALLIVTDQYADPEFEQLRSPQTDGRELQGVLADPAIGGFEVEEVLTNATADTMRRRIGRFLANRTTGDLLLLYFSGHGMKDPRGRFHLVATDTEWDNLPATGLAASTVHEMLDNSRSERIVVILDCCFSGAFPPGVGLRSSRRVHAYDGLQGSGRVIITSSSSIEYSFEEGVGLVDSDPVPSVFTSALVRGLRTGLADRDGDGRVSVSEMYEYAADWVSKAQNRQNPEMWNKLRGPLYIAQNPFHNTPPLVVIHSPTAGPWASMATALEPLLGDSPLISDIVALVGEIWRQLALPETEIALRELMDALDRHPAGGRLGLPGAVDEVRHAALRLLTDPELVAVTATLTAALLGTARDPDLLRAAHRFAISASGLVRAARSFTHTHSSLIPIADLVSELGAFARTIRNAPEEDPSIAEGGTADDGVPDAYGSSGLPPEPRLVQAVRALVSELRTSAYCLRGMVGYPTLIAGLHAIAEAIRDTSVMPDPAAERLTIHLGTASSAINDLADELRSLASRPLPADWRDELLTALTEIREELDDARHDPDFIPELADGILNFVGGLRSFNDFLSGPELRDDLASIPDQVRGDDLDWDAIAIAPADMAQAIHESVTQLREVRELPTPNQPDPA
ncbi:hypothetical protein Aph01nite_68360 [Acrocarpospora phusangensis]|uniref:Peptidase C14 caspase domain-containing protein n=1 Tax=Acrocarpospora phusangensis TaxID=1070424 RepID=A0A919QGR9_9ACTN|nr:caspase family protein [Acrocarpospora phusangensis]GIH28526.1 hypothetical protein Aph01nite_68360 [Acrocarpospora phusangensis]